jgi:hypothetical protein
LPGKANGSANHPFFWFPKEQGFASVRLVIERTMNDSKVNPRTVNSRPPIFSIIAIVLGCILLLGAIVFATTYWNRTFVDARMTGVIIEKSHTDEPRAEVTFGTEGVRATSASGVFTFTVRVRDREGETNDYTVWVPEVMFHQFEVGDTFDVGPYLVPGAIR